MYYFIISEQEIKELNNMKVENTVVINDLSNADFIVSREKNRDVIGQFTITASISNFAKFKEIRKTLYRWTEKSSNCYLNILLLERKVISESQKNYKTYNLTGFAEGYIVNFGEDYNNDKGNTLNLVVKQRNNTEIGTLFTKSNEVDINQIVEYEKSGFERLSSLKISRLITHLEKKYI